MKMASNYAGQTRPHFWVVSERKKAERAKKKRKMVSDEIMMRCHGSASRIVMIPGAGRIEHHIPPTEMQRDHNATAMNDGVGERGGIGGGDGGDKIITKK